MAQVYCVNADVQRLLALDYSFGTATTPSTAQVASYIDTAQDEIDQRTQHAWRTATVTKEFYDLPHTYGRHFFGGTGLRVFMRHTNIKTLASGSGDKLEVWNGNSYDDWLSTRTEGRAKDYWQDEEQGELYINLAFPLITKKALRLTYRHGETIVPGDIRDATAMLVAMKIVISDDRSMVLAETGDHTRPTHDDRYGRWLANSNRILVNRAELNIF